jgi:hypothetical protein
MWTYRVPFRSLLPSPEVLQLQPERKCPLRHWGHLLRLDSGQTGDYYEGYNIDTEKYQSKSQGPAFFD